jgi:AraC-like DNA-binding protein
MNEHDCEIFNNAIARISLLREGFYLSSFLIQPHIFHINIPFKESQMQEHTHPTFEISLVLEGKYTYCINGREFTLAPGDISIIPPRVKHCWRLHNVNTVVSNFMCFISGQGLHPRRQTAELIESMEKHHFHIRSFSKYEGCIKDMLNLLSGTLVLYDEEIQALQKLSYIYLFRMLLPTLPDSEEPCCQSGINRPQNRIIEEIRYYIFDNLSRPIHQIELQKKLGLSKEHLNRLFKKSENISIGQFINKIKIERASIMLETTNYDIKTVAREIGFRDVNYFCTVFKKYTSQTPTEFRMEKQNS